MEWYSTEPNENTRKYKQKKPLEAQKEKEMKKKHDQFRESTIIPIKEPKLNEIRALLEHKKLFTYNETTKPSNTK